MQETSVHVHLIQEVQHVQTFLGSTWAWLANLRCHHSWPLCPYELKFSMELLNSEYCVLNRLSTLSTTLLGRIRHYDHIRIRIQLLRCSSKAVCEKHDGGDLISLSVIRHTARLWLIYLCLNQIHRWILDRLQSALPPMNEV